MVSFRICFDQWSNRPDRMHAEGPVFRVYTGAVEHPLWIHVLMDSFDVRTLQDEMGLQSQEREPHSDLRRAVLRYAIQCIEQGLREELFPVPPTDNTYELPVEKADISSLRQLLQEKTCTYQIREGRDLLCSVASSKDQTLRGHVGLQTFAPTSRALCRTCSLPDTDYVCSHFMHPEVLGMADRGMLQSRQLLGALCDLGKSEVQHPAQCHAGGHGCWERIFEQEYTLPAVLSSLTLPEALDFLDICWRLAFDKHKALFRFKSALDMAMLSLSCTTRDELSTRLSALANILKSMDVPDELLSAAKRQIPKDQTFTRLLDCLEGRLDAADYQACQAAVRVLRAVNDIRTAFQHNATARPLPAVLGMLALPYPLPACNEAWDCIRAKTAEALGVIREKVYRYATSSTSDTNRV